MKKAWFEINPSLLEDIRNEIHSVYPNLHLYVENRTVLVRGSFPVLFEGKVLNRYSVEIEFPHDYPESIPIVREVAGRIPRTLDFHIVTPDGICCLFLPDERWEVYPKGSSFLDFLNGPVHNYFLGQTLFALGQLWPFGEHTHGVKGIYEYYAGLLGTSDLPIILNYLLYLSKPRIKGHWSCPCGSNKRLRNCHFKLLLDLRQRMSPKIAQWSLISIISWLKSGQSQK